MLNRILGPKAHYYSHLLGIVVLIVGLGMSKAMMSIGALWCVLNILLQGDFKNTLDKLKSNPLFLVLFAFFGLHVIGLLWSSNLHYGLDDLRKKLPLLAISIGLLGGPTLQKRHVDGLLKFFVLLITFCSLYNLWHFSGDIDEEFRSLSVFTSHIRFSLMVAISVVVSIYFLFTKEKLMPLWLVTVAFGLYYTIYSQVFSGLLALAGAAYFLVIYLVWKKPLIRYTALSLPLVCFGLLMTQIQEIGTASNKQNDRLETYTAEGGMYFHDTTNFSMENGEYIYRNICLYELERDWNRYSKIDLDTPVNDEFTLRIVLYRYMSSKGLRKDAEGLAQLSNQDIKNIENGQTSVIQFESGILGRLASLKNEIQSNFNPNGSTLLQRIYYWKTGWHIIKRHPILGVGTGDVQNEFDTQYILDMSPIDEENRLRAHNSFLTAWLTWGPVGIILFLSVIHVFLKVHIKKQLLLPFVLIGILVFSFFIEDTLETLSGITLFMFIYTLFGNFHPEKSEV